MARGESPKDRSFSIGLALAGAVALAGLCTVFAVVSSFASRSAPATPAFGIAEPFRGATLAFTNLGSRDAARAITYRTGTLGSDPIAARQSIEAALVARGYVSSTTAETAMQQLPFDVTPTDLAGTCGVVVAIGDRGASIRGGGIASGTAFEALDPSAFTIASCGDAPVHLEGVGAATTRVWLYPGLTASLLGTTGLSADALLAHAEAEHILRGLGYAPTDEVVEVPVTSTGAFASLDAPTTPASGCVPFVAYVVGAGRASLPSGQTDFLDDRALSAMVGCASGSGWSLTLVDDATPGARAFVRAYGAGSAPSTTLSVGSVTPVDVAHATWPTPIAELPPP